MSRDRGRQRRRVEVGAVHVERGTPATPQKAIGGELRGAAVSPEPEAIGTAIEVRTATRDESSATTASDIESSKTLEDASVCMMLGMQQVGSELPTLKTEAWPHGSGKVPNPLSIAKGRRILATGLAKILCGIPGAGIHGHALVAEKEDTWNNRNGAGAHKDIAAAIPVKSEMPITADVTQISLHAMKMQPHRSHQHLKEEGKDKLTEWCGKAMFVDVCRDGALPPETTPNMMFEHLEGTCAQPNHFGLLMTEVEKEHDSPHNPKATVESCFMTLQEAREKAALLEQPFTDKQTMNKATTEFIEAHGREAEKAERRWDKKDATDRTWMNFKQFWKEEIHSWTLSTGSRGTSDSKVETLATELMSMRSDVSASQAESLAHQRENQSLRSQQIAIERASQAEQLNRSRDDQSCNSSKTSSDEISALTEAVSLLSEDVQQLKTTVNGSPPDTNAGRGEKCLHCWKCGCQTTHWTRQCRFPDRDEKAKCRTATGTNAMGGSEHQLERFGKCTSEFRDG